MTTKAEREHLDNVASLGCIACLNMGFEDTPAEIHHIREGQGMKRASHMDVIPLCHKHHRTGGKGVAFHAGAKTWREIHGNEWDLLEQVQGLLEYRFKCHL